MPDYYEGSNGMQPFDVIDAFGLDFYEGNVVKYIVRWRKKNGLEDLYKARTYIEQVIARAETEAQVIKEKRAQEAELDDKRSRRDKDRP